jgi:hypothetical protein
MRSERWVEGGANSTIASSCLASTEPTSSMLGGLDAVSLGKIIMVEPLNEWKLVWRP